MYKHFVNKVKNMKMYNRFNILVLTSILIVGCNHDIKNIGNTITNIQSINQNIFTLSKEDIKHLDNEYLNFKTKALTINYFQKKLVQLIGNDNGVTNGVKILKELKYAQYKTESSIPFQALKNSNTSLYNQLKNISQVITQRNIDPPFDIFIAGEPTFAVSTVAGSGGYNSGSGFQDGDGSQAMFSSLSGIAIDSLGNIYTCDNQRIRKIANDTNHTVSTIAGSTFGYQDGNGSQAKFGSPSGIAIDSSGNLYIAEAGNNKIRKIANDTNHTVSTIAGSTQGFQDGDGTQAQFNLPIGLTIDNAGNIYVTDYSNKKIRKVANDANHTVSTIAGSTSGYQDGVGSQAMFNAPYSIAVDSSGDLYVADQGNHKIRKISNDTNHTVSTIAGIGSGYKDDIGNQAKFSFPYGITIDSNKNLYVSDYGNHKIRKINNDTDRTVTTIAGSLAGYQNGIGTQAMFSWPTGITIDSNGNLYVSEAQNFKIRKLEKSQ